MILRALHPAGYLDISSQEMLHGELVVFRRSLQPGQTIEVIDDYRALKNIDSAIKSGLLELVSYDKDATSHVMQEELEGLGGSLPLSTVTVNNGETKVVDSVSTLTTKTAKWFANVIDTTNSTVHSVEVYAQYDGVKEKYNVSSKLGSADVKFSVDVSGTELELKATATSDGQKVAAVRLSVINS